MTTSFNSIAGVINATVADLHNVCLLISFSIILLSIVRNHQQFGEFFGARYLIVLFFVIFFMIWFPKVGQTLFLGTLGWGAEESKQVIARMNVLVDLEMEKSGFWGSIGTIIPWTFFRGAAFLGKYVREIFVLFLAGSFLVLKTLSPLFIGMLAVPETKSMGVNFLMITLAIILSPITIVFGDLLLLWCVDSMWTNIGIGVGISGEAGVAASLSALASGASKAVAIKSGVVILFGAFAAVYLLLIVIAYVGIPWAIMSLFRGGGIGNPLAMTLNTTSNIMTMSSMVKQGGGGAKGIMSGLKSATKVIKNSVKK